MTIILPPRLYLFDYNELIFICAKADLFGMFNAGSPVCGGKHGSEVVVTFVVCFRKAGIGDHRLGIYCICACNVKSHRVKGGKESHIRNNGCVVFGVAVTVRRYVDHQVNVKSRASVKNTPLCILRFCSSGYHWIRQRLQRWHLLDRHRYIFRSLRICCGRWKLFCL